MGVKRLKADYKGKHPLCAKQKNICHEIPLLSVGKVVPDGVVRLLQQSVVTRPGATFQQLHHLEPVSQLDPEVNGEVTAETRSVISKDLNQTQQIGARTSASTYLRSISRYMQSASSNLPK